MNIFWFWSYLAVLSFIIGANLFFVTPLLNAFSASFCAFVLGDYIRAAREKYRGNTW